MSTAAEPCPCGSGRSLGDCCGRYHQGEAAPTAEALMRSRYSAFVLGNAEYLLQTWHPSTRPAQLDLAADDSQWLGLKLCACRDGGVDDATGQVEFIARYRQAGRAHRLHETSRFVREPANDTGCCYYRWYYLDGDLHTP